MNYLCHLYFSKRTPLSYAGNLMGDFKLNDEEKIKLPKQIVNGIENHRLVDKLTDQCESVKRLKRSFSSQRRRFAGLISDIAFDYFLAKHWSEFETQPLDQFISDAYFGLSETRSFMPEKMIEMTENMIAGDWLTHYQNLDGISASIDGVSRRIRFENKMNGGIAEVVKLYAEFEDTFFDLFQMLRREVEKANLELLE